jgi:hypothetical protein
MQERHQIDNAKDILYRHCSEFKKRYLIYACGIGYKIQRGKLTNKVAIIFYVKEKKSKEELLSQGITPIPEEIEGIPTDVISNPDAFKLKL